MTKEELLEKKRAWNLKNKDKIKLYRQRWNDKNPEKRKEQEKRWRNTWRRKNKILHPEKYTARTAMTHAIGSGTLVRGPCVVCGVKPTQGHHADYSKPLEVTWLCVFHHQELHKKERGLT